MTAVRARHRGARAEEHRLELVLARFPAPLLHELAHENRLVGVRTAALAAKEDLAADDRFELASDHLRRDADRRLRAHAAVDVTGAFLLVPVRADDWLPRRKLDAVRLLHVKTEVVQPIEPD